MSSKSISNIELPKLAILFEKCKNCFYVNIDIVLADGCPNCTKNHEGNIIHFNFNIHALLQLLWDSYQNMHNNNESKTQKIGILLFFCTLVEVLLEHFLTNLMKQQGISNKIQERLLCDNLTTKSRVQKIFLLLTGDSWKNAIKLVSKNSNLFNYSESISFYIKQAVPARNRFLHQGDEWPITAPLSEECIYHSRAIICLFVELNNRYVSINKIDQST